MHNNEEFMAKVRTPKHPLVASDLFSRHTYRLDCLHVLDHNGVAGLVVGNIFALHLSTVNDVIPGANQENRLDFLNDDIKGFCSTHNVQNRVPLLKLSNIFREGFPELHGRAIKAANTRSLVAYALDLQKRAVDIDPNDVNHHALKIVQSLQTVYDILYSGEFFLTPNEVGTLHNKLTRMGVNYQLLATQTSAQGQLRWKQTPKLHYAVGHMAMQAALINPRYVQTYGSEGLVGKVCQIFKKTMDGPYHATVQRKILRKYKVGMFLEFS